MPIKIKVVASISGYGWYAFVKDRGEESAEHGWSVQEALEGLLDRLEEEFDNLNYTWS